jgi:hypothetical protein
MNLYHIIYENDLRNDFKLHKATFEKRKDAEEHLKSQRYMKKFNLEGKSFFINERREWQYAKIHLTKLGWDKDSATI